MNNVLQEHLDFFLNLHSDHDWLAICLQGSQNYGLATPHSNVNMKLLFFPSLNDIIFDKKILNTTLMKEASQDQCELIDVRKFFKTFARQNINFVELFFSEWSIVNSDYLDIWNNLKAKAETLARLNKYETIQYVQEIANSKLHKLTLASPSRLEYVIKYGIDPKQLYHLARMYYFLSNYIEDKPYKDCIYIEDENLKQYLIALKTDMCGYSHKKGLDLARFYYEKIKSITLEYKKTYKNEENPIARKILDDSLTELMKRSIKKGLA